MLQKQISSAPLTSSPIFSKSLTSNCSRTDRRTEFVINSGRSAEHSPYPCQINRSPQFQHIFQRTFTSIAIKSISPSSTIPRTISGCVPLSLNLISKPSFLIIRHNSVNLRFTVGFFAEITTPSVDQLAILEISSLHQLEYSALTVPGNTNSGLWQ